MCALGSKIDGQPILSIYLGCRKRAGLSRNKPSMDQKMIKKYFAAALLGALIFFLGFISDKLVVDKLSDKKYVKKCLVERENSYIKPNDFSFINPLLDCGDVGNVSHQNINIIKTKVVQFIDEQKANGSNTDIHHCHFSCFYFHQQGQVTCKINQQSCNEVCKGCFMIQLFVFPTSCTKQGDKQKAQSDELGFMKVSEQSCSVNIAQ